MNQTVDIGVKIKDRIQKIYTWIAVDDIPAHYSFTSIDYKTEDIAKYSVVFWHRLLRKLFEDPTVIEFEVIGEMPMENISLKRTYGETKWEVNAGDQQLVSDINTRKVKIRPIDWKYYIKLPSGGIIILYTESRCDTFCVDVIIVPKQDDQGDMTEAKAFIDLLLAQANREKDQLFNPKEEFQKKDSTKSYLLHNVYLANYLSAKTMLETAISKEEDLNEAFYKEDDNTPYKWSEKKELWLKYLIIRGTYYCSAITYYFMALEGFVNLIYHAFLKRKYRDKQFRIDERLDLEQKIRLMPALCYGFEEDRGLPDSIYTDFNKLKNYRNSLFHSKVEDSLKHFSLIENGFVYGYNMDSKKTPFLPSYKGHLTIEDANDVKYMVDEIITSIQQLMSEENRNIVEKYFLKEPILGFKTADSGETLFVPGPS